MRHNRVRPGKRREEYFRHSKTWTGLPHGVLLLFVVLTSVFFYGCAGFVNGSLTKSLPGAFNLTAQPSGETVTAGQTATFTVVATGWNVYSG